MNNWIIEITNLSPGYISVFTQSKMHCILNDRLIHNNVTQSLLLTIVVLTLFNQYFCCVVSCLKARMYLQTLTQSPSSSPWQERWVSSSRCRGCGKMPGRLFPVVMLMLSFVIVMQRVSQTKLKRSLSPCQPACMLPVSLPACLQRRDVSIKERLWMMRL